MPNQIERSGDTLTVRQYVPLLARLLMLPLLFGAGYLLRIFVLSVGDAIGGAPESELLAGQLICLVFGLSIGVPGLLGLLVRTSLVIDKAQGRVTKIHDFLLFKFPRSFNLSHVSLITITWEDTRGESTTGRGRDIFNVNMLRPADQRSTTVAFFNTLNEANDLATELSVALGIPLRELSNTELARTRRI